MKRIALVMLPLFCAGCLAFNQTEFPKVAVTAAAGAAEKLTLAVNGFETAVTEVETIESFSSVYVPGYYGRHHYRPGYYELVPSVAYVSQSRVTDVFLKRARERFEDAGYSVSTGAAVPDYAIEVSFAGPIVSNGDVWSSVAWNLFTVFLFDYTGVEWTAKLRIRDNKTGKVVLSHEYQQRYEAHAAGLIPLFSIASCDETRAQYAQFWCLGALTDRAVADATAFFATLPL